MQKCNSENVIIQKQSDTSIDPDHGVFFRRVFLHYHSNKTKPKYHNLQLVMGTALENTLTNMAIRV